MNWLRICYLIAVTCLVGCGPQVPGPTGGPAPGPEAEEIDPALEAEAAAASKGA